MNVRDKLLVNLFRLAACVLCACVPCSCVIYTHRDRLVQVSNRETGAPVSGARFQFTHAVPAVHLPRSPEPIDVLLGANGEAKLRLPVVMGWARVNGVSVLLQPEDIRDGGSFEISSDSKQASRHRTPPMLLRIEKVSRP